jgi:cytochrome o ubiquinol oxidase subunit 2
MKIGYRIGIGIILVIGAAALFKRLIGRSTVALLSPRGAVALQERDLIRNMVLIMLIVVIPTFIILCAFAWKYRAGNENAVYDPDKPHSMWSELVLWAIPAVIVGMLWALTWGSAHTLDPYNSIQSSAAPLTIEVVALPWKWLFIYPAQNIATVNFIEFPVNTPVHFELTADAPMSSFWIPQLGSQIYAMAAMETQLNLIADRTGDFTGKDTEINGAGYAGMTFIARSASQADFDAWVGETKQASSTLDLAAYNALAAPSVDNPQAFYSSVEGDIFDDILMKFMTPAATSTPVSAATSTATTSSEAMPMMPAGMNM